VTTTTIRTYGPGDDAAQVGIYNEAAAGLPGFKPASLDEVRRRGRDPACDPKGRFLAVVGGRPAGYATFQTNGRVSFPWCRKGHEDLGEPLLERVLAAMRERGLSHAWAAYRADWAGPLEFLARQGFARRREMVNFVLDLVEMPTPTGRPNAAVGPLRPDDVPALQELGSGVVRTRTAAELGQHLFHNPYFAVDSLFALRGRAGGPPQAVGLVIANRAFANPRAVDPAAPCFRLGAFGTEGLTTKRINGLFSFLAADTVDLTPTGLDLMSHAALRLQDTDVETFAAQVPSDASHLLRFYDQYFRRQGIFPVLERAL
jgi:hypothetical protein